MVWCLCPNLSSLKSTWSQQPLQGICLRLTDRPPSTTLRHAPRHDCHRARAHRLRVDQACRGEPAPGAAIARRNEIHGSQRPAPLARHRVAAGARALDAVPGQVGVAMRQRRGTRQAAAPGATSGNSSARDWSSLWPRHLPKRGRVTLLWRLCGAVLAWAVAASA